MRYASLEEVKNLIIKPTLGEYANDFDVDTIARECFAYQIDQDEKGRYLLNTAGYEQVVSDDEFWARVAANHLG